MEEDSSRKQEESEWENENFWREYSVNKRLGILVGIQSEKGAQTARNWLWNNSVNWIVVVMCDVQGRYNIYGRGFSSNS